MVLQGQIPDIYNCFLFLGGFLHQSLILEALFYRTACLLLAVLCKCTETLPIFHWLFPGGSSYYIKALCLLILVQSDPEDISCSLSVLACFMFALLMEPKCAAFPNLCFSGDLHVKFQLHLQPLTPATQFCPALPLYFTRYGPCFVIYWAAAPARREHVKAIVK